jgi:hypothetical protein
MRSAGGGDHRGRQLDLHRSRIVACGDPLKLEISSATAQAHKSVIFGADAAGAKC